MHYIKLIHSQLTIIISPVLLITFGKLIIKLMFAPGVGYVSYNYQGYDVLHCDEKHSE
ncbi:dctR protein [Escherichia coli]|nr:dctR protein [Escherichia coli]